MAKIGLFGGAFDPFHNGHLAVCRAAAEQLGLDRLIVIPTFVPPHKSNVRTAFDDRYNMVTAALKGTGFAVSDYEMRRGDVSYSAATVEDFAKMYPGDKLYFIIGGDSYRDFHSWYEPWRITDKATLAVYPRDGAEVKILPPAECFKAENVNVSSTLLREKLQRSEDISEYVPEAVNSYINEHNLY